MAPYTIPIRVKFDIQEHWHQVEPAFIAENVQGIDSLTHFNKHFQLLDFDDFCQTHLKDYVILHDMNPHKDRSQKFHTVDNFMRYTELGQKRILSFDKCFSLFLGDSDSYWHLIKLLSCAIGRKTYANQAQATRLAFQVIEQGIERYLQEFHERNPYLYLFEAYVQQNRNEPMHLHARIMPFLIRRGHLNGEVIDKPTLTFVDALSRQYRVARIRQKLLCKFKNKEKRYLVNAINAEIKEEYDIDARFSYPHKIIAVSAKTRNKWQQEKAWLLDLLSELDQEQPYIYRNE